MTSKSKPGVKLKYGGCLFSATGSSNISAVDRDIWSKFAMVCFILCLPKCETSKNQKGK